MSHCIKCMVVRNGVRDWEITSEGRVWPCCYFANAWDKRKETNSEEHARLRQDKPMWKLMQEDSEWNSLNTYGLEDIIKHEVFWNHIWHTGWDSDNPSPICLKECNEGKSELNVNKLKK